VSKAKPSHAAHPGPDGVAMLLERYSYAQQATEIAVVGIEARVEPKPDEFQPLGVFAMVQLGEEKATNLFQLAVNKEGIIHGEYYNAPTDTIDSRYGSVDKNTQSAARTGSSRCTRWASPTSPGT
jgi:hypothetical protein